MKGLLRDLFRGTMLALPVGAGAFLVARYAFGRMYYLGLLLPAGMLAMLLIAWFLHLKSDGFLPGPAGKPVAAAPAEPEAPHSIYVPYQAGILKRRDFPGHEAGAPGSNELVRLLLWAAAELALVSVGLYHLAGVGTIF